MPFLFEKDVLETIECVKKLGIEARVVGMHTVKPIDIDEIRDSALNTNGIVTSGHSYLGATYGGIFIHVGSGDYALVSTY